MQNNLKKAILNDSPAREFLQSNEWRNFQESVGRKTFNLEGENFWANIIEHNLPIVGKPACIAKRSIAGRYFYIPRGPEVKISNFKFQISNQIQSSNDEISKGIQELFDLAKKNNIGWIRIEPETEEILEIVRKNIKYKIVKAPHDVQPREIFVIDITKSEDELLAEMKAKTRYNIRLAEKKGVEVKISNFKFPISNKIQNSNDKKSNQYIEEFLRLTAVMAKRQGINSHPEKYYRKMLETIPGDILKLYVAEHEGKVIAANLVVFYGDICIYLHGASDDEYRNVMAPYLLQWHQICDAKKAGCVRYDLGGVKNPPHPNPLLIKERGQMRCKPSPYQGEGGRRPDEVNSWSGITKFKTGFSPQTLPTVRPGSYDVALNPLKYQLYRAIQKLKMWL